MSPDQLNRQLPQLHMHVMNKRYAISKQKYCKFAWLEYLVNLSQLIEK
jgi:hypothetical protein